MKAATLKLEGLGGQRCHVEINRRDDGSVYVSFYSDPAYGFPALELDELEDLTMQARALAGNAFGPSK